MLGVDLAVACHYLAPDEEVDRFLELVPVYDTTGRRRVVAPLVGETLVVDGERHSNRREGRVRLVTYTAVGRSGVGVRRDGAIFDAGYADMHALIADGAAGLERAGAAGRRVGARRRRHAQCTHPSGEDPLLRGELREPR